METVALHTRLKAGREEEYERVHRTIPADLHAALREAGVHEWRIWRDGPDLFHLVTVEDYRAMRRQLRDHPANVAWQARVGPLHDVADSYEGDDDGIGFVWALSEDGAAKDGAAKDGAAKDGAAKDGAG
jgi:L-rhamnose mutarotase